MSDIKRWSGKGRIGILDKASLIEDLEDKLRQMLQFHPYDTTVDIYWVLDTLYKFETMDTKQVKYYDEDESVWKIGEVIVEQTERSSE